MRQCKAALVGTALESTKLLQKGHAGVVTKFTFSTPAAVAPVQANGRGHRRHETMHLPTSARAAVYALPLSTELTVGTTGVHSLRRGPGN